MSDLISPPVRAALGARHVELRVWQQFLAVAEHLHFGRAALSLNMTQPPLTQAIAGLEAHLGMRLFDRNKRNVKLSATGEALLPQVRDLLSQSASLPALARAASLGEVGRLRLAFVSTVGYDLLPQWVQAFRAAHPGVALELFEATGDVQLNMLARGDIDAGFVLHSPGAVPLGLAYRTIAQEALVVALPDRHGLAQSARFDLRKVLSEPLVIFPRRIAPSLHDLVLGVYHAQGVLPDVAQEAIQMQTIVNLVSAGLGVAWVPESVMQFQRTGVIYRRPERLSGIDVPACETSLVWRADSVRPSLDRFLAFVSAAQAKRLG